MACIIKTPTKNSKGVIIFTDLERDQSIGKDKILQEKILSLKDKWLVGMHHNWTRFDSMYNYIFDFAMYLESYSGKLPLIPLAACNFVPEYFKPSENEKFWDILYVARAVRFKNIPDFFQSVRKLYDSDKKYRVLFICPIPTYKWKDRKSTFYNVREVYDEMFSEEEKDFFTLLTTNYRDPFPFDKETLAYFFRSSRIFVHASNREKQGRVAGYAWACGMPVVGLSCIGMPLPDKLKTKPYFYEAKSYNDFPKLIEEAIKTNENGQSLGSSWPEVIKYFNLQSSQDKLDKELERLFKKNNLNYESKKIFSGNLGIRIARHHNIDQPNANSLEMPLLKLVDILLNNIPILQHLSLSIGDPEIALVKMFPTVKKETLIEKAQRMLKETKRILQNGVKNFVHSDFFRKLKNIVKDQLKN